jgi:Zn-dependent protease with chaperone function
MRFWQQQSEARSQTLWLLLWFVLLVLALVVAVNAVLALGFKLLMPLHMGWPRLFFETNTAVVLLFVIGGCWVESSRLRDGGGARVAHWMGGAEVQDTGDALLRRLLNVVDEMALASGQPPPRVFVLPRETAINAFAAGWTAQDAAVCVTQGALDRLTRAELQGLVAHEFGHIAEGDGRLCMRLLALVWGLSLVHGWGRFWMRADEVGRVHVAPWVLGAMLAALGWLGWLAGRLLQAAVSRQREFLADARAVQYTRDRDGLGQVLRKVLHEQQTSTDRLSHPQADAIGFLWLHTGSWMSWLASHPPLPERISRVYGGTRPPLPTTFGLSPHEPMPLEPRATAFASDAHAHQQMAAALPGALGDVHQGGRTAVLTDAAPPISATVTAIAPGQDLGRPEDASRFRPAKVLAPRLVPDVDTTQALGRLERLSGPMQRRMALLAFLMTPQNQAEQRFWEQSTRDLHGAAAILADVRSLPPSWRLPEFERQLGRMAYEGVEQRRSLVLAARELLRADGKVSARDRLWWLALRHRLGDVAQRNTFIRPVTGQGRELNELADDERDHVAQLSAYLARLLPQDSPEALPSPQGLAWFQGVMRRCQPSGGRLPPCQPPEADSLMHALAGVQELSWMMRPQLVRAWVEEALNHSPGGLLSPEAADALRLMAGLLDTPLPPALAAHYPRA